MTRKCTEEEMIVDLTNNFEGKNRLGISDNLIRMQLVGGHYIYTYYSKADI